MRKVRRPINVVSGGEDSSSSGLSQNPRYSRLLQNFYIDSNGHVRKVPGYSTASNSTPGVNIKNGLDFVKSDGTNKLLVSGATGTTYGLYHLNGTALDTIYNEFVSGAKLHMAQVGDRVILSNGTDAPKIYDGTLPLTDITKPYTTSEASFTGTGLDDLTPVITDVPAGFGSAYIKIYSLASEEFSTTYTTDFDELDDLDLAEGSEYTGTTDATFEVKIDGEGDYDTLKYNYNGGIYNAGNEVKTITKENDDFDNDSLGDFTYQQPNSSTYTFSGGKIEITPTGYTDYGYIKLHSTSLRKNSTRAIGSWETKVTPINYVGNNGYVHIHINENAAGYPGYQLSVSDVAGVATVYLGKTSGSLYALSSGVRNPTVLSSSTGFSSQLRDTTNGYTLRLERDLDGTLRGYVNGVLAVSAVDTDYSDFDLSYVTYQLLAYYTGPTGIAQVALSDIEFSDYGTDIIVAQVAATSVTNHDKNDYYDFEVVRPQTTVLSPLQFKWSKNGGAETTVDVSYGCRKWIEIDSDWSISPTALTSVSAGDTFRIQVDGANTPDTFKWRVDGGAWTEGVNITAGAILLQDGVSITFDYFTGHHADADGDSGDAWEFDVGQLADRIITSTDGATWTSDFSITTGTQTVDGADGIGFLFASATGHTVDDVWEITASEDNQIGKMHTYKGRLWGVYRTGMLAIHSALQDPSDYRTADNAGYIDFSTVLPKGDTLLDISSVINSIVFFFRNHIAIYTGTDPTADGDFAVQQVISDMGVPAEGCVIRVGNDIYFLTKNGIKSLRETTVTGSLNIEGISAPIDGDIIAAVAAAGDDGVYSSTHCQALSLLMFQIDGTIFCYQYNKKAWSRIVLPDDAPAILSMFTDKDGDVYFGGENFLFKFNSGSQNFGSVPPIYKWHSAFFQVSDSDMFFTDGVLRCATPEENATIQVQIYPIGADVGHTEDSNLFSQEVLIPTRDNCEMSEVLFPLFGAGKWVQMRFTEEPSFAENAALSFAGFEIRGEIGNGN